MSDARTPERRPLPITSELLSLLDELLDTTEKVELAWHLTDAKAPMLASELRARTLLDARTMQATISDLVRAQVIELSAGQDPTVRLADRARRPDFEALMSLYTTDRAAVVSALASIAMGRIRAMAARMLVPKRGGEPR